MIANRGAHTPLPATALNGAPVDKRTYKPGQLFRGRRPTQDTRLIVKAPSAHTTPGPQTGHRPARPHRAKTPPSDLETTAHAGRKEVESSKFFIRIAITPRTPRPSSAPVWRSVDTYTAHHPLALTLRTRRWSAQTGDHARHGSAFFPVTSTKSDMRASDLILFLRTLS